MLRIGILTMTAVFVALASWGSVLAGDVWTGNVNFVLGTKQLDRGDWGAFDSHDSFGALISFGKRDWPVQIAIDVIASGESRTTGLTELVDVTGEFGIGVRKIWEREKVRPFLATGIATLYGERELGVFGGVAGVNDETTGLWIDGGAFWRLGKRFNLGVEARISRGEINVGGADIEAGGEHLGLILGFGW